MVAENFPMRTYSLRLSKLRCLDTVCQTSKFYLCRDGRARQTAGLGDHPNRRRQL